jgi:cyclomaltodextrinase / maltogenic alpha-amylase / neopullulanase
MIDRPDWVRDAVFYQVFPDRFCNGDHTNDPADVAPWDAVPGLDNFFGGDLAGITSKLVHLERLGATGLYLTPIFAAGTNHRYDAHDYLKIDPMVGDVGSLRELVQEAHARGVRVLLDGVFNHVGDGFWAFRDLVARGDASAYRDWFYPHSLPVEFNPPNYQTCGGTHYLPKLNIQKPAVAEHLHEVALHWIEAADIDGWRLDVPWKVPLEFWHEFRARVKAARPDAYLVGEAWWSWGDMRNVFDGLMNYRLRARIFDFCIFGSQDAEDFAIELELMLAESDGGDWMLNLVGSHDTPRLLTVAGGDTQKVRLALVAMMTLPGTPLIYYGDEVGMEGGEDPDCRRTMDWNESTWDQGTLAFVRQLIDLRRDHAALRRGKVRTLSAFNRVLAFSREAHGDAVVVILNPGASRSEFAFTLPQIASGDYIDALTGDRYVLADERLVVDDLRARSAVVLIRVGG